jgi:hypothetical protein
MYYAMHPLSREHIFISPDMSQMRSELENWFPCGRYWRENYPRRHRWDHKWCFDDSNPCPILQKAEQQKIVEELMLYAKMEGLELDTNLQMGDDLF